MGDDRPPVYTEGEKLVVRASSLGGPICQLVLSGLGHEILPPPPWLQKAFDAGNFWEGPILAELRRRGWREVPGADVGPQTEIDWEPARGIVVRFPPDDLLIPVGDGVPVTREVRGFPEGPVLVEAKALSAANYEIATKGSAADLPYAYDWQLSAMMLGLGERIGEKWLPAAWVTVNKSAEEANETSDPIPSLHAELVARPPVPKPKIVQRLLLLRKLIDTGDIPADPSHHGASPCRFLYLCPAQDEQEATVYPTGDRATEIARWAQWLERQREAKKLAGQREAEAKERLLELLGDDDRVVADGWRVVRSTYDRKAYEVKAAEGIVKLTVERGGAG